MTCVQLQENTVQKLSLYSMKLMEHEDGIDWYRLVYKDGIDWCSVISCGLHNTNSNIGCKNSLKSRIVEKNSSYFVAGFNCHLVHLATDKGGQVYESISSFSCEDHQCDLYYFLKGVQEEKES